MKFFHFEPTRFSDIFLIVTSSKYLLFIKSLVIPFHNDFKSDLEIKPEVFRSCLKSFWIWKGECYSRRDTGHGESEDLPSVTYKQCCDFRQVFSELWFNHGTIVGLCKDQVRTCEKKL